MVVGLTVGGWFAAKVIGDLISLVSSYVGDQYEWQTGMKDELQRLGMALPKIRAVVGAAEDGHIKDSTGNLEAWLLQLKEAADEAEDVLDEREYLRLEEQVKASENIKRDTVSHVKKIMERVVKRDPTLMRLKEAVRKLDGAAAGIGDFLALVDHNAAKQQHQQSDIRGSRESSSVLCTTTGEVFGRNNVRDEIVKQLLINKPGTNLPVVLISGMGGVGKTTLAQYVLDDERVKKHFDLKIWICVSDIFDVTMLTRKILEAVTGNTPSVTSFGMLQVKLKEVLSTPEPRSFLLVLDDVWNDKDWASWEKLFAPLRHGHKKSKIVVTTRMTAVAKVIKGTTDTFPLKGLEDDDCWSLLMERSFGDEDPDDYPELQSIGHQIAVKLKGSPLAAKTLGGLLRSNLDDKHWRGILESDILKLEQGEGDIMPVLWLSYDRLPAHLQYCFAYCSIFSQDYRFDKDDLVRMWLAAGLIQRAPVANETMEDIGAKYFEDLLDRSFFDPGYSDEYYVMHDHLHDLARHVSTGKCLRLPLGAASKDIPNSVRHLSITINDPSVLENMCKARNLRTLHLSLIVDGPEIHPALGKLFRALRSLRVLKLHTKHELELPDTIGELIHLRYLNLDNSAMNLLQLPKSLCRLYHLQYIILEQCQLPEGSSSLTNLRFVGDGFGSVCKIASLGKLSRLQKLDVFNVGTQHGYKIGELKDMRELRELRIIRLENLTSHEEAYEANLKDKECLNTLELEWGVNWMNDSEPTPEMHEKVLDGLQPNSNLKKLSINYYMGARSPFWMEASILSSLKELYLSECFEWKQLPPLGQLPFLKILHFSEMRAITRIGPDVCWGGEAVVFPSLEELVFENMYFEKIEWSVGADGRLWFPRLRRLRVDVCLNLIDWPALPPSVTDLYIFEAQLKTLPAISRGCNEAGMSQSKISIRSRSSSSSPSSSSASSSLSSLSIINCSYLESVAMDMMQHKFIEHLKIQNCPNLQASMIWTGHHPLLPLLQTLILHNCGELDTSLPALLQGAPSLRKLELSSCNHITCLPLEGLVALQHLRVDSCRDLMLLEGFQALVSLESLHIRGCRKLVKVSPPATTDTLPGFAPPLHSLEIQHSLLQLMLPVLIGVTSLAKVGIFENRWFESLPAEVERWLQSLDSLRELELWDVAWSPKLPTDPRGITRYVSSPKPYF